VVTLTLRVVRFSNFTPSEASSCWMSVVAVAFGICRLSAARVMVPVSTTRTKTCIAWSLFMIIRISE
jgi:hypothetical protein